MKSVGVKLKVLVTDEDVIWDDNVDGLVLSLNPTPTSSSAAYWISTSVTGQRSRSPTRSINVSYLSFCALRVRI